MLELQDAIKGRQGELTTLADAHKGRYPRQCFVRIYGSLSLVPNPAAARRTAARVVEAGNFLESFPERGRPIGRNLRELVSVWPYIIRYRLADERVVILRVRHGARASE